MTTVCKFTIKGEPVAWARARTSGTKARAQGFATNGRAKQKSFYTAKPQADYKATIKDEARLAMREARMAGASGKPAPLGTALELECRVFLPVPKSWNASDRAAALEGRIRPTSKPDLDNWVKLPMDGMNGIVWEDDAQVVGFADSGLWYSLAPRLEVHVRHARQVCVYREALPRVILAAVLDAAEGWAVHSDPEGDRVMRDEALIASVPGGDGHMHMAGLIHEAQIQAIAFHLGVEA